MSQIAGADALSARKRFDDAAEKVLLEQCRRQDYEAFSKIVDAYQARVMGFVRRMLRSEEEARDVTQEVFIKAFQAMGRFDGRSSLRTWLFRIAHNLCIDRARKAQRSLTTVSLEPTEDGDSAFDVPDERWSPQEMVLTQELKDIVEDAIASMSTKLRTVLILHDQEDMGYEEIAAAVDVPVGTVKSRLFLARAHIKKHASEYLDQQVKN